MDESHALNLAWASDIHLDHCGHDTVQGLGERIRASGASMLLLGGDIATAKSLVERLLEVADLVGVPTYFVLGNHDYYWDSISSVRSQVASMDRHGLMWLPREGPQELAPGVALVGHGGWGDARIGDFTNSGVVLNDYVVIQELRLVFDPAAFSGTFGADSDLKAKLRELGDDAAGTLAPQLELAARSSRHVVVLTHVPPFREACWHEGHISDEYWLPAFTCGAVGNVLDSAAAAYPECQFTVLCGHTHGGGSTRVAANMVVHTQAAEYGHPDFKIVEIHGHSIEILDQG